MAAILANSSKVKFEYGVSTASTVIPGLLEIPDFAETKETVEVTTLDQTQKTYINGLKDFGSLSFKFLYDAEQVSTLKALGDATQKIKVTLSDGSSFEFDGQFSVTVNAASSGARMEMTLDVTVGSELTFTKAIA